MRSLSVALFVAVSAASAAQGQPVPDAATSDVTEYAFDDEAVLGDTIQPGGEVLHVRKRGERQSLVRARSHFVRELLESVERL